MPILSQESARGHPKGIPFRKPRYPSSKPSRPPSDWLSPQSARWRNAGTAALPGEARACSTSWRPRDNPAPWPRACGAPQPPLLSWSLQSCAPRRSHAQGSPPQRSIVTAAFRHGSTHGPWSETWLPSWRRKLVWRPWTSVSNVPPAGPAAARSARGCSSSRVSGTSVVGAVAVGNLWLVPAGAMAVTAAVVLARRMTAEPGARIVEERMGRRTARGQLGGRRVAAGRRHRNC